MLQPPAHLRLLLLALLVLRPGSLRAQTQGDPPPPAHVESSPSNTASALDRRIRAEVSQFKGTVRLFARNLTTGSSYGLGEGERVRTASTIKLPVMVETFAQVAAGKAKWDDALVLTKEKKVGGSGVLFELHDGLALTLRDAVHLMIVLSDNSATNLVLDVLSTDAVNDRMDSLGFPHTRVLRKAMGRGGDSRAWADPANKPFGFGVSTSREMVHLLEKLDRGEIVSPEASREMIALLKRQQDRRGIARALLGTPVASKPGALERLRSEVAIVYCKGGPVAMAITCDDIAEIAWNDNNPAYLLLSRLATILIEELASKDGG